MQTSSPSVKINIEKSLLDFIKDDARKNSDITTIGILIGRHEVKKETGEFLVHITDVISIEPALRSIVAETAAINDWDSTLGELELIYKNSSQGIVGWYHSHPGHGIFLSGQDNQIHKERFSEKWQVALVVDPFRNEFGFFAWANSEDRVLSVHKDQIKQTEKTKQAIKGHEALEKTSEFGSYLTIIVGLITVLSLVFGIATGLSSEHLLFNISILVSVVLMLVGAYLIFLANGEKEQIPIYIDRHNIKMVSVKKMTGKKRTRLLFGGWGNVTLGIILLILAFLVIPDSPTRVSPTSTPTYSITSTSLPTYTPSVMPPKSPTKTPSARFTKTPIGATATP